MCDILKISLINTNIGLINDYLATLKKVKKKIPKKNQKYIKKCVVFFM